MTQIQESAPEAFEIAEHQRLEIMKTLDAQSNELYVFLNLNKVMLNLIFLYRGSFE